MKNFKVNGKTYKSKEFDFNMMCELEDMGFSIAEFAKKPTVGIRAYMAVCMDGTLEDAGKEIEEHIVNGGALTPIINAMSSEMEKSDFFRALTKRTTETTPETQE